MKTSKTVIQRIAAAALALAMMITAVTGDVVSVAASTATSETQVDKNGAAKEAAAVNTYEETENSTEESASTEKAVSTDEENAATDSELSEEEQKWQNKLMAKVDNFLYVRAKADGESKIVGKMYKGDCATIVKEGSTWTKITSGKVKGYVKNSYCVTGTEALEYAKTICDTVAKSTTDGLRIREEQSTESAIITMVSTGDKLVVDDETDTEEDWVAVKVNSDICYVSADYVTVALNTGKAISLKEEAKKAREKAASSSKKSSTDYSASTDEVTLLAAIAQCEVGGVSTKCMTAVAAVVLNRVKSSLYPNDIKSVIYQKSQFGPASSGKLARRLASGVSSEAKKAAQAALNGSDPTNGGMYFKLASSGKSGVVIGPVVFY
jgi:hypothetical protein